MRWIAFHIDELLRSLPGRRQNWLFGNGALNQRHQRGMLTELHPTLSRTFRTSCHYQYR